MKVSKNLFFLTAFCAVLAACGGGNNGATPIAVRTPATAAVPAPVTTTIPLSGTSLSNQPAPQPSGYAATISAANISAPAGTTILLTSSVTQPTSLPALQSSGRKVPKSIRPLSSGSFSTIFYDSVVPSQAVTVGGALSFTQSFPNGGLTAGGSYYLGFYDSTQATPAWVTINGPVTPNGNNLTFSGVTSPFTLSAGALYGFAIFTLASPSNTPPPAQSTLAYIPNPNPSPSIAPYLNEVDSLGNVAATLPIFANGIGLDDAGNIYAINPYNVIPGATPGPTSLISYSPSGAVLNTYAPASESDTIVLTSGAGSVASFGNPCDIGLSPTCALTVDVWDAGTNGGAPSRTIAIANDGAFAGVMGHDGTLYLPTYSSDSPPKLQYQVYPPGSGTPSRTITDTYVTAANQQYFSPSYMAVGADGTLYVTEYSYNQPDALAGLYIYPPNGGTESFVPTTSDVNGAGPQGVDVDASGNIYVANNNAGNTSSGEQTDSLHDITVYAPGGASVLRHITGTFDPYPLVVSGDGTVFFTGFPSFGSSAASGSYAIAAGTTTVTQIATFGATSFALYDGNRETTGVRRNTASVSAGSAASVGGAGSIRARFLRRHI